jgi:D-alanyl-D-alanine carboxypeptidase (penicillin-binding protein 5/6)
VLAESLAGAEDDYAKEMTEIAEKLGAKNSSFKNSHGLAEPGHYTTVKDLAIITSQLIKNFPELYHLFKQQVFTYNNIKQYNRNPLLKTPGLDATGTKTGHTDEGGYGLVGTAEKDGRRLIVVVNGLPSEKKRAAAAEQLLNWGFREFDNYYMFEPKKPILEANVWLGKKGTVPLIANDNIKVTLPKASRHNLKIEAIYSDPIPAPIKDGQLVGRLEITSPGTSTINIPLFAGEDIKEVGIFGRLLSALNYIIWGHS